MKEKDFYTDVERQMNIIERAQKFGLKITEPVNTMSEKELDRLSSHATSVLLTNIQSDGVGVANMDECHQSYIWSDGMGFTCIGWFDMNDGKDFYLFYRYDEENKRFVPIPQATATTKDYVAVGRQIDSRARVILLLARYQF